MPKRKLRLVVDTNWWVSFVMSRMQNDLARILQSERCVLLASLELQEEILSVLEHAHLQKFILPEVKAAFKETFPIAVQLVEVKTSVAICRDEKDNFLLALSKDGKADYLITGDKDLLVLKQFGRTFILRLPDFLEKVEL